jgi:D-alanyl-lipoteichoic acid acyltransferase DltB (MBOAT superfamily)
MRGLFIFSTGLFKKLILADTFAIWANAGFNSARTSLDFFSAWATSLSYTFQLYFDFSGYCDMGLGAALLLNIRLPINFNSPYKALDIQDFWRRWHMTLSRFLRDYIYIPLGGNRCSNLRIYFNLMATFALAGLWHGASWMFVIWGMLHGAALVVHRVWSRTGFHMPRVLAWFLTFNFINAAWVFFRAESMDGAMKILRGMADVGSVFNYAVADIPTKNLAWGGWLSDYLLRTLPNGLAANFMCIIALVFAFIIIKQKNSLEFMQNGHYGYSKVLGALFLFCTAMYCALLSKSLAFLYFNF